MASGGVRRLRVTATGPGGAVAFRVRVVTLTDGRLGCTAPDALVRLVEQDPEVDVEQHGGHVAEVLRSGRAHAEVHGRLRRARLLPLDRSQAPVLVMRRVSHT